MKPRVYIACSYGLQAFAHAISKDIDAHGMECSSSWVYEEYKPMSVCDPKLFRDMAKRDFAEINESDAMLLITGTGTGGKEVEFGWALDQDKPIWVVGDRINIFHYLGEDDNVFWFNDVPSALQKMVYWFGLKDGV